jgi:putative hydrolase of the HAD superfamily
MSIKAVVFDYGKVICFPPEEEVMESLAKLAGLPPSSMDALVWKYRDGYDRGTLSGKEYYRQVLAAAGVRRDAGVIARMVQIDLDSWKRINPDTVRLMEDVKKAGLKLGILSNLPREFLAFARANFPVFSLPDRGIFSCEIGAVKPEGKIYGALLAALGTRPEETVFFDDMERNTAAAAERGIRSFVWQDPETAREELRKAGLRL